MICLVKKDQKNIPLGYSTNGILFSGNSTNILVRIGL